MKFLISLGTLTDNREACLSNSLKFKQASDSIICIYSDEVQLQKVIWPKDTEFIQEAAALNTAFAECINPEFWEMYISRKQPQYISDFLRLQMACKVPDLFYMDTDVRLYDRPVFETGKPYFGQAGHCIDFFMFYVNNCCSWFQSLVQRLELFNPMSLFIPFKLNEWKLQQETSIIPERCFKHKREKWNTNG